MLTFADIPEINRATRRYLAHAETQMAKKNVERKLSQDTFDRLEKLADSPSPVEVMVNAGELLYARRSELDSEGRNFVHGLMTFSYQMGFHGLREDRRGLAIAESMARDEGEEAAPGVTYVTPEQDPPAKPEYLVQVDAEPAPLPAPPPANAPPPAADA